MLAGFVRCGECGVAIIAFGRKTKDEVLKYLADSFTVLRRAIDTVTEENAFASMKGVFGSAPDTRIGLIVVAVSHSSNHYGQVVEYLRMNGLTPPR